MKCVFNHQDVQTSGIILNKYEHFSTSEVVGRGSETQPRVSEYLITYRFNG